MNMTIDRAGLTLVSNEARGRAIKERAEALGIYGGRELERATESVGRKVSRNAIGDAFKGEASDLTFKRLEDALNDLDNEMGVSARPRTVRLTFHDVYGIGEIIAEGDSDEVVEAVSRLMDRIRRDAGGK